MKGTRIQRYLLAILVLLLPYHTMATYLLGGFASVIRFWKEGVIAVLFFFFCLDVWKEIRTKKVWYRPNKFEGIFLVYMAVTLVYILKSDSLYQAVYIGRIYLMPILLIPVVKTMELSKAYLRKLLILVMANTAILSLWGIVQFLLLGDDFLMKIGYPTNDRWGPVQLADGFYIAKLGDFQRLVSTFAAPNTCGLYLAIVLVVTLFLYKKLEINKLFSYAVMGITAAALLFTFSRTSWIAAGVALFLYALYEIKWTKKKVAMIAKLGGALVLVVAIVDGIFNTFDVTIAFIHLIVSTLNGSDSSVIGHLDSAIESLFIVGEHPWGLGMGENGPRAEMFMKEPNLTESAYFLMIYEVGLFGAMVYFSGFLIAMLDNFKQFKRYKNIATLFVSAAVLVVLTAFLSLPYVQDFEILVYIFIIMALGYHTEIFPELPLEVQGSGRLRMQGNINEEFTKKETATEEAVTEKVMYDVEGKDAIECEETAVEEAVDHAEDDLEIEIIDVERMENDE